MLSCARSFQDTPNFGSSAIQIPLPNPSLSLTWISSHELMDVSEDSLVVSGADSIFEVSLRQEGVVVYPERCWSGMLVSFFAPLGF